MLFEDFQGLDWLLLAATAVFIIWEIIGILRTRGKIQMKAKVYGRYIATGIVVVLAGIALFVRRNEMNPLTLYILLGGLLAASVLYLFLSAGFCDRGLYYNGRLTKFDDFKYYNIERETESTFCLRLVARRREFVLDFTKDQQPLVEAWMVKGKIPDMHTYLASQRS